MQIVVFQDIKGLYCSLVISITDRKSLDVVLGLCFRRGKLAIYGIMVGLFIKIYFSGMFVLSYILKPEYRFINVLSCHTKLVMQISNSRT